jgi:hypothetical protein
MDAQPLLYATGEDPHIGDRVQYKGTYATVVFVSDGDSEESAPGYEDYTGSPRGLVICDDDGEVMALGEPDSLLVFVDRG